MLIQINMYLGENLTFWIIQYNIKIYILGYYFDDRRFDSQPEDRTAIGNGGPEPDVIVQIRRRGPGEGYSLFVEFWGVPLVGDGIARFTAVEKLSEAVVIVQGELAYNFVTLTRLQ